MLIRKASAVAVGGGLLSALAAIGWPALLLIVAVTSMAVTAACWVLNDPERPERLALLIHACRSPASRLPSTRLPRQREKAGGRNRPMA